MALRRLANVPKLHSIQASNRQSITDWLKAIHFGKEPENAKVHTECIEGLVLQ